MHIERRLFAPNIEPGGGGTPRVSCVVRRAEASDFPVIARFCEQARLSAPKRWTADPTWGPSLIVAFANPGTAGSAMLGLGQLLTEEDALSLVNLEVSRSSRRGGVGRQIVAEAARRAAQEGKRWVSVWVKLSNDSALRFYEKLGFVRDPEQPPASLKSVALRLPAKSVP